MDIVTGQRTFFLGVSAFNPGSPGSTGTIHVPFRDSSGNFIRCNYFKVDLTTNQGTVASGCFVAEPSGVSIFRQVGANPVCYATTALPGSGICGVGTAFVNNGSTEWHGANGEVCTAINIRVQYSGTPTLCFGVTYGNLMPYSMLRETRQNSAGSYDRGR
jgi:hypothetical protein